MRKAYKIYMEFMSYVRKNKIGNYIPIPKILTESLEKDTKIIVTVKVVKNNEDILEK